MRILVVHTNPASKTVNKSEKRKKGKKKTLNTFDKVETLMNQVRGKRKEAYASVWRKDYWKSKKEDTRADKHLNVCMCVYVYMRACIYTKCAVPLQSLFHLQRERKLYSVP